MRSPKAKYKEKKRAELVKEYKEQFANPYIAAGLGYIDKWFILGKLAT
jgi:acetyl-CoA carboxylase carboxyltransferase component